MSDNKALIGFSLIALATAVLGILMITGVPISPWWLLAPILTPVALVALGVALIIASITVLVAVIIIAVITVLALALVSLIPVLVIVLAAKMLSLLD